MLQDNKITISDAEMTVMRVIWTAEEPMTSNDIIDRLRETKWNQSTILTLIKRLHEKKVLTLEDPLKQRNKSYIAAISETEYQKLQVQQLVNKVFGGSAKGLFAALFDGGLDQESAAQLKAWYEEAKKEEL